MSTQYNHLTTLERVTIMVMLFQRQPLRTISALLGRDLSSISREIKRIPHEPHYDAVQAASRAQQLRHVPRRQRRLSPDSELFQVVVEMLRIGWSPQQIARRLRTIGPGLIGGCPTKIPAPEPLRVLRENNGALATWAHLVSHDTGW